MVQHQVVRSPPARLRCSELPKSCLTGCDGELRPCRGPNCARRTACGHGVQVGYITYYVFFTKEAENAFYYSSVNEKAFVSTQAKRGKKG